MFSLFMRLLGGLIIEVNGRQCKFGLQKSEALLIYVLLNGGQVNRALMAEMLYPSGDVSNVQPTKESSPKKKLNDTLNRLKRGLLDAGVDKQTLKHWFKRRRGEIDLTSLDYTCDVLEFERLTQCLEVTNDEEELNKLKHTAELYQGDFLGAFRFNDVDAEFDTWISTIVADLQERYFRLLLVLSISYMACKKYEDAIHFLRILLDKDPETLEAYGLLMICYSLTGNKQSVEKIYLCYEDASIELEDPPDEVMLNLQMNVQQLSSKKLEARNHSLLQELIGKRQLKHDVINFIEELSESLLIPYTLPESSELQKLLHNAEIEARSNGFLMVGTPHLFLTLCAEVNFKFTDRYFATSTTTLSDSTLKCITNTIRDVLGKYPDINISPERWIEYTLETQNVLESARSWAEKYGASEVSNRHLWLALLEKDYSLLAEVLKYHNVNRKVLFDASQKFCG